MSDVWLKSDVEVNRLSEVTVWLSRDLVLFKETDIIRCYVLRADAKQLMRNVSLWLVSQAGAFAYL